MSRSPRSTRSARADVGHDPGGTADLSCAQFDRSPHAVLITSGEHHVARYANPVSLALTRLRLDLVLNRPLSEVLSWPGASRLLATLDRVYRTGEAELADEIDCGTAEQESREWSLSAWPISCGTATPTCLVLQLRDLAAEIEERERVRRMAEQMREINERLLLSALREEELTRQAEAASEAKSVFLATMSHELRTPLTAILGYEELLSDGITGPVTGAQRTQLTRIKTSAVHLLALIDEILTFSRVEAGHERVQCEPMDVAGLLDQVRALVSPLADGRPLSLRLRAPEQTLVLESDAMKVKQILVNLLSNAIKFTDRGGVVLTAREEGGTVAFEVRDTGVGIRPEYLERIFDSFWQVEQSHSRKIGGSGLGLAVSRRLARLLGGDLIVESVAGTGSTFTFRLPLHQSGPTPDAQRPRDGYADR